MDHHTAAWLSFPTIATEGVARCKSARLVARSHWLLSAVKEVTTNRPRCLGEGFQPKVTSQCYMVMPWCLWCESIALQKCAKIQLFRIISVRIRKHDFQYSRYSQQQLTWPSVHCQTNTSPNSCAVDFSLRQVIWMPWSLVSKNGPRALLCWWHVVHLHWKWLNQRLDMHFWTHVPWCLLFARFWWEIPER